MITKDGIEFNNSKIEEMIQNSLAVMSLPDEEISSKMKQMSKQEAGEIILAGYWSSLLGEAMMNLVENSKWFEFTYETLPNLPLALAALFKLQKTNPDVEENKLVMGKTIASVLYGLAMNEHGCQLRVTHLPEKDKIQSIYDWSVDMSLKLGTKREADFREAGILSVINCPIEVDGGMSFDVTPLITVYKKATGVDLSEKGLVNIIIGGE